LFTARLAIGSEPNRHPLFKLFIDHIIALNKT
jgi:hypothetical protein